jgi:hypothetical protein
VPELGRGNMGEKWMGRKGLREKATRGVQDFDEDGGE